MLDAGRGGPHLHGGDGAGMMAGTMRVFLAGATGVIGRRLVPLLVADGHVVIGTTRHAARADALRSQGAEAAIVDVFDVNAMRDAVVQARPDVVIHQLTDLAAAADPAKVAQALAANARMRDEGTRNLLAGARAAGVTRVVAQSIAFAYALGDLPHCETDPLNVDAPGAAGASARGVASLERQVLEGPWQSIVLRYGRLYGAGIADHAPPPALHVDDAAELARRAVRSGAPGLYNVADDDGFADIARARDAFGWTPRNARRPV